MLNVQQTTSPRMFAVVELTAYFRPAVTALLAVAAAFVVSRRLAGALETPLGPFQLLAAGILLAGLAQIAHAPAQTSRLPAGSVLISLAIVAIAASLSLTGSHSVALLGFWTALVGEELWAWRGMLSARRSKSPLLRPWVHGARRGGQGAMAALPTTPSHAPPPTDGHLSEEFGPPEPAADVLQQLTLRTTAEGGQELSGWLRIPLAAGQRTGSLHVAFCPSFSQMPQVQAEPVAGPECRIKTAQVLPYGARLDVKLDESAAQGESLLVWFHAAIPGMRGSS
jgi:hypothetical protein